MFASRKLTFLPTTEKKENFHFFLTMERKESVVEQCKRTWLAWINFVHTVHAVKGRRRWGLSGGVPADDFAICFVVRGE